MFADNRSKKIIILAHCLLNQNSISDGTADCPSQFREIIDLIMKNQIGILQLPCPEVMCLGLDRGDRQGGKRQVLEENTRIGNLMSEMVNQKLLRVKAEEVATLIQDYRSYGFRVIGVVGINRSPSCGIETTTKDNAEEKGKGVFMGLISEAFAKRAQNIMMIGVKTSEIKESVMKLKQFIHKEKDG
ncbi:MAG: DUF523 domain-containing protein [Deltaproteobacteria bacterium]|nr:DUF523 domain-containing protein [Deltaproteobacteria bacterium]